MVDHSFTIKLLTQFIPTTGQTNMRAAVVAPWKLAAAWLRIRLSGMPQSWKHLLSCQSLVPASDNRRDINRAEKRYRSVYFWWYFCFSCINPNETWRLLCFWGFVFLFVFFFLFRVWDACKVLLCLHKVTVVVVVHYLCLLLFAHVRSLFVGRFFATLQPLTKMSEWIFLCAIASSKCTEARQQIVSVVKIVIELLRFGDIFFQL